ncbi:MAG: hypothetical protein AABZ60_06535 [Planctomycetota bacterium]
MSRQVTIQTKLQEESLVTQILKEQFQVPFYFREFSGTRKLVIESPEGSLELVQDPLGFKISEEQEKLERVRPFLNKLQQTYSLERLKKIASQAGYILSKIQQGPNQEWVVEVSKC